MYLPRKIYITDKANERKISNISFNGITHLKLDNHLPNLLLPSSLTHLTINFYFGHPITFPPSLVYLKIVNLKAPPIHTYPSKQEQITTQLYKSLPLSLTHLELGFGFDTLVSNTHINLTHLILAECESVSLPPSLTHFSVKSVYRARIASFPPSLEYIYIHTINSPLINLPDSLKYLHIYNYKYKHAIEVLPSNLISLEINECSKTNLPPLPHSLTKVILPSVSLPPNYLPSSLKYLEFHPQNSFNQPIDNLNNITYLSLPAQFNQPIDFLPSCLQILICGSVFNQPVDHLPNSLLSLSLSHLFNQPLNNLPGKLVHLKIHGDFNQPLNNLPPLTLLKLSVHLFNHPLDFLPCTLEYFYFTSSADNSKIFSQPIILPPKLTDLTIYFLLANNLTSLPPSLRYLCYGIDNPLPPLPDSLHTLICRNYTHPLTLPPNLKKLEISACMHPINFPPNLRYLNISGRYPFLLPNSEFLIIDN